MGCTHRRSRSRLCRSLSSSIRVKTSLRDRLGKVDVVEVVAEEEVIEGFWRCTEEEAEDVGGSGCEDWSVGGAMTVVRSLRIEITSSTF
jgi:hypothetical protein